MPRCAGFRPEPLSFVIQHDREPARFAPAPCPAASRNGRIVTTDRQAAANECSRRSLGFSVEAAFLFLSTAVSRERVHRPETRFAAPAPAPRILERSGQGNIDV